MKIWLSGANGFSGRNVRAQAEARGWKVRPVSRQEIHDQLSTSIEAGVSVFIHAAARVHQPESQEYAAYFQDNVELTSKAIMFARRAGCRRFIYISSVSVYGTPREGATYTLDSLPAPDNAYGMTKLIGEYACINASRFDDMDYEIVRVPLIVGLDAPGNLSRLVKLIERLPIVPFGGLNAARSYVSKEFLVESLMKMAEEEPRRREDHVRLHQLTDLPTLTTAELSRKLAEGLGIRRQHVAIPSGIFRCLAQVCSALQGLIHVNLPFNRSTYEKLNGPFVLSNETRVLDTFFIQQTAATLK